MDFNNFAELTDLVKKLPQKTSVAVVAAQDYHTLEAVSQARREGILQAYLIGNAESIQQILEELGDSGEHYTILEAATDEACMQIAAALVSQGKAGAIMKGKLETSALMKGILNKENNLRKGKLISVTGFYETPYYHKMFAVTDMAINIYPDAEAKKHLIANAVDVMHKLGVKTPKVACLAAIEHLNPKMKETVEAAQLKDWYRSEEIAGCVVEGPISFDLAMTKEAAEIKGYQSPVAGDADLLVMPDLCSGNIMTKAIVDIGGAQTGGLVLGAQVPVILVSRAAKASDKFNSIVLAAYAGRNEQA